jgi:hypothetical protein
VRTNRPDLAGSTGALASTSKRPDQPLLGEGIDLAKRLAGLSPPKVVAPAPHLFVDLRDQRAGMGRKHRSGPVISRSLSRSRRIDLLEGTRFRHRAVHCHTGRGRTETCTPGSPARRARLVQPHRACASRRRLIVRSNRPCSVCSTNRSRSGRPRAWPRITKSSRRTAPAGRVGPAVRPIGAVEQLVANQCRYRLASNGEITPPLWRALWRALLSAPPGVPGRIARACARFDDDRLEPRPGSASPR